MKDANVGSLLRLFKSEQFDIWMAVTYLHKYPTKGIIDYISHEFYRLEESSSWLQEFEYYLPQLCHLVVAYPRDSKALLQYLMDLCSRSLHFALRIGWLFCAIASPLPADNSSKLTMDINERCAELRLKSDLATMNGRRPESLPLGATQTVTVEADKSRPSLSPLMKSTRSQRVPVTDAALDPDLAQALSQVERCDYYKAVQGFAERLSAISDSLRAIPPLERNVALAAEVTALNARLAHPPHGALLYFPPDHASSTFHVILRITPGEAIVLNSRDRAPYLLYIETLKPSEDISPASPYLHLFAKEIGTKISLVEKKNKVIRSWTNLKERFNSDSDSELTAEPSTVLPEKLNPKLKGEGEGERGAEAEGRKPKDSEPPSENAEDRKSIDEEKALAHKDTDLTTTVRRASASGSGHRGKGKGNGNAKGKGRTQNSASRSININQNKNNNKNNNSGNANANQQSDSTEDDGDFDFETDDLEDDAHSDQDSPSPMTSRSRKGSKAGLRKRNQLRDAWIEESPKTEPGTDLAPSSAVSQSVPPSSVATSAPSLALATATATLASARRTPASSPPDTPKRRQSILFRREDWRAKVERIRSESPFGQLPGWNLRSVIVKFGDDCRQERLALQLIGQFDKIWKRAKLPLYVLPYDILVLSPVACLIETIVDSKSVHQLKKEHGSIALFDYFLDRFGPYESQSFKEAQCNFIDSLAGYSLVTYILQIKDRHNGNILMRDTGHLVHIDFGFMLSNSPGSLNFESGAFKLTAEYVQLMGGKDSPMWEYFKASLQQGFLELRKHSDHICGLVGIMRQVCLQTGTTLPGLAGGQVMLDRLKERFLLGKTDKEVLLELDALVNGAIDSWRTRQYDNFQYLTNGILY